jgi:hypothetical protein
MNHLQQAVTPTTRPTRRGLAHLAGAVALACAILPSAHADTTIDFENVPLVPLTHGDVFVSNGFSIGSYSNSLAAQPGDLVGLITQGSDSACWNTACPTPDSNPTRYLTTLNDGLVDITHNSGKTFSIKAFDATFVGAYDSATYPTIPGYVRLQGFLANGNYLTQDYRLDGPGADGFEFGHYLTNGAFSTAQFAEVYIFGFTCAASGGCTAFNSNQSQFAIDNIATTATLPVPEPSTWLMFGSGLLGLVAAARRRQRSA